MTNDTKKPREFWIIPEDTVDNGSCYSSYFGGTIHVIEKRYYVSACQEVLRLEGLVQQSRIEKQELQARCKKLVDAIKIHVDECQYNNSQTIETARIEYEEWKAK